MKIILSRKGFDNQYGGQPSPILPDGTLLSMPIPSKGEEKLFSDLCYNSKTYLEIIKELKSNGKIKDKFTCHLDPDLRKETLDRDENWKPLFGQTMSSLSHLEKKGVTRGDIFLFFGSFRQTEFINGKLSYSSKSPEVHLIFGYLQIGRIYKDNFPKHFDYHPHTKENFKKKSNNAIFEAAEKLNILPSLNGAGCFNYDKSLVLTKSGLSKSKWELPNIFREVEISYHSSKSFREDYFQSAAKGQEFVISNGEVIENWVRNIIEKGTGYNNVSAITADSTTSNSTRNY